MIESLLLAATRVCTFSQQNRLTNATGFFFQRDERLFVVTSRHVLIDEPTVHFPDRIEIELHIDVDNMAKSIWYSIPLYKNALPLWRQGMDTAGDVDAAVIEIERENFPASAVFHAFTSAHLNYRFDQVEVGSPLMMVGFPLGFHDTLHHMPVVRHAVIASSFGLRFQGEGYFLTDARTHRGTSGAPVVMRVADEEATLGELPWMLLGIHSSRLDVRTRDTVQDEILGLNCAWYADILMSLTEA